MRIYNHNRLLWWQANANVQPQNVDGGFLINMLNNQKITGDIYGETIYCKTRNVGGSYIWRF